MLVISACQAGHVHLGGQLNDISDREPYAAAQTWHVRVP